MPFDGTNFEQPDDVLDVLRRAREGVLSPGGWLQGEVISGNAACAIGWLFLESNGPVYRATKALFDELPAHWRALDPYVESPHLVIGGYNDAGDRTQSDIVALFDRAIAKREAELQTGRVKA